jgi:hypothetical protein
MKNLSFIFLLLIISGCCAYTSGDCFCDPPEPELSASALDWIILFEHEPYFVFEDDIGNLDMLLIERTQDIEWIGGNEWGTDGDVKKNN